MSEMLRPADIAVLVQTALNDKAVTKYDAEEVGDKLYFHVTADYQVYERLQKGEYEVDDYQSITPVIISRVDHYEYPADYLRYEETYTIQVYGYADQLTSLEKLFKEYTVEENTTNKSVVISPFRITKSNTDLSFGEDLDPMDGTLNKRVQGTGEFTWSFLDGIMTTYDITIEIDGEEMPYISYNFVDNLSTIQSQEINTTGQTSNIDSTSFYEIILTLPYISTSPVIKSLYNEFYEGTYNKTHTLTYYDTALDETFTFDVIMSGRLFEDIRPKVLDFVITLRKYYPTATIEIDDVEIPLLSFVMNSGSALSTSTQINSSSAQSAYLGENFQIDVVIPLTDQTNTKVVELFEKVMDYDFSLPHQLTYTKGTYNKTYSVVIQNGSYELAGTAEDSIRLTFVEQDDTI
jgi:hypothetical protein